MVAVLVVLALGVVMGVQAPSGSLPGRTQIAATLAMALFNMCCWETVLLDSPAPRSRVVGSHQRSGPALPGSCRGRAQLGLNMCLCKLCINRTSLF